MIDPVGSTAPAGSGSAADRLTRLLFRSTFVFWARFVARAAELDLTPAQAHALMVLQPERSLTMRELADELDCDPSTVTGLADRLEAHGLIGRQAVPGDRRVRALGLTDDGVERRTQLMELLARAPESVQALDPHAIERLADGLERILAAELGIGPDGGDAGAAGRSPDGTPDDPSPGSTPSS